MTEQIDASRIIVNAFSLRSRQMPTFADRIREILAENQWPARELGRRAGLAETHISAMLKPDYDPRLSTLAAVADAAGVTLQWLASGALPKHRDDIAAEEALRRAARQIVDAEERKSTIRPVSPSFQEKKK